MAFIVRRHKTQPKAIRFIFFVVDIFQVTIQSGGDIKRQQQPEIRKNSHVTPQVIGKRSNKSMRQIDTEKKI